MVGAEGNGMGAGAENANRRWKKQFASRNGPRKRTTLGNATWWVEVGYGFLLMLRGCQLEKRNKNEHRPSSEKARNWTLLAPLGSTGIPSPHLPGSRDYSA